MKKVKLGSQDIQDSQSTKAGGAGGNTMENDSVNKAASTGLELLQQQKWWPNIQAGQVNINIVQNNNSTGGSNSS